jgi:hypothetical protein
LVGCKYAKPYAVAKHDVGVSVGVEVHESRDVVASYLVTERCHVLVGRVVSTAAIIRLELDAVAVDIHVGQEPVQALGVHDAIVLQMVAAIGPICLVKADQQRGGIYKGRGGD